MGKPPKKAPSEGANASKRMGVSLSLGTLIAKKPARAQNGPTQLQARKLVDSNGASTIEGLKVQIESLFTELYAKIDTNAAAVTSKIAEGQAAVHKQAKADHAKTCQVLQDCQAAIELATKQHQAATKQVTQVSRQTAAALDAAGKALLFNIREAADGFNKELSVLKSKAGIKV